MAKNNHSKIIKKNIYLSLAVLFLAFVVYSLNSKSSPPASKKKTKKQSIEITQNLLVPEPNEKGLGKDIAIPKAVIAANKNTTSKIRTFDITAENNTFIPTKIIVYEKDIVRINFTARDKKYDISIPDLGIKQEAEKGETKKLEFQAVSPGSFVFLCQTCSENKTSFETATPKGVLLAVPISS